MLNEEHTVLLWVRVSLRISQEKLSAGTLQPACFLVSHYCTDTVHEEIH